VLRVSGDGPFASPQLAYALRVSPTFMLTLDVALEMERCMKPLRFLRYAGLLGILVAGAAATAPQEGPSDGWTKNWYCDPSGTETHHRITQADDTHWADGTHGFWPGDCAVHEADT
jgi:hypothetical protein